MQIFNHKTGELITVMDKIGDYIHVRNTGNDELDYEDRINLFSPGWNKNGLGRNKADPKAKSLGDKEYDRNARGLKKFNFKNKEKEDYFEFTR